jgi:hypothetical protein
MSLDSIKKRDGYLVVGFLDISQGETCAVPQHFGSFNVVIEAFWVNYPFCYTDGRATGESCTANIACAYPISLDEKYKEWESVDYNDGTCKGFDSGRPVASPASPAFKFDTVFPDSLPGDSDVVPFQRSVDSVNFYKNLFDYDDDAINNNSMAHAVFFNSFHTASSRNTRLFLQNKTVVKLASVGGWFMGGSVAGSLQDSGSAGRFNNWAVCLDNIPQFIGALEGIVSLGYDGIDFDCETVFAGDATGLSSPNCGNLNSGGCYGNQGRGDSSQTVSKFVSLLNAFRASPVLGSMLLSLSPRSADVLNPGSQAPLGFFGQVFEQTKSISIDMLNLQFYNDRQDITVGGDGIGANVRSSLSYVRENWPHIKNLQVGVVARSQTGSCDSNNPLYCITSDQLNNLWFDISDPLKNYADGVMSWGITSYGSGSVYKTGDPCDVFYKTPLSDNNWLRVKRNPCTSQQFDLKSVSRESGKTTGWLILSLVIIFTSIVLLPFNIPISIVAFTIGVIIFLVAALKKGCNPSFSLVNNTCVPSCNGSLTLAACQAAKTYGCVNGVCTAVAGGSGCDGCKTSMYTCSVTDGFPTCKESAGGEYSECPQHVAYLKDQTGVCTATCSDVAISEQECNGGSLPCATSCVVPAAKTAGSQCSSSSPCPEGLTCQKSNQCGNKQDDAEYVYNYSTYLCRAAGTDCFSPPA